MNIISVTPPKTDCEILSELHKYIPTEVAPNSGESSDSHEESSDLISEVDFSPNP
jgi:hypothetical protein